MIPFLFTLLISCTETSSSSEATEQAVVDLRQKVRTTTIRKKQLSQNLNLTTTLEAVRSAVLVPKVQGRIADVFVRIGDNVKKGDPLLQIEQSDYLAGYQESEKAMELAYLQSEQAYLNLNRFKALLEEKAVTQSQFEEVEIGAKLAKGQYARAKIGFDIARSRLNETKLVAPFDGTIVARNVEIGEMLGSAMTQPPLMIADLQNIRFIASISESEISSITTDSKAFLRVGSEEPFAVDISRINQAVDPVTNTVQIEGVFDNTQYQFRHGQSAELSIHNTSEKMVIPRQALLERKDQSATVFLLNPDQTTRKQKIRYGRADGSLVPVFSGLKEGDIVLTAGHSRLVEGDSVIVISSEAE